MNQIPASIRIGTCSWKYDSWKGLVYSDNVGEDYLSEYAKHYNIVEVDQWFWSLFGEKVAMPKPEVVQKYAASVPKDFRFSIKVPNSITLTHQYTKSKRSLIENPYFLSNQLFENFLNLLRPMAGQIDSLIFQFEYLNKLKMSNQYQFQDRLHGFFEGCPKGLRYCIETRNQNYLNRPYFEFLQSLGLYHVFLQGYWMPPIFETYGRFKDCIKDFTLIRLHGPDRKGIEKKTIKKWNAILDPKDGELHKLGGMINDLLAKEIKVTLNVNNHYEGSAPMTIQKFVKIFLKDAFI